MRVPQVAQTPHLTTSVTTGSTREGELFQFLLPEHQPGQPAGCHCPGVHPGQYQVTDIIMQPMSESHLPVRWHTGGTHWVRTTHNAVLIHASLSSTAGPSASASLRPPWRSRCCSSSPARGITPTLSPRRGERAEATAEKSRGFVRLQLCFQRAHAAYYSALDVSRDLVPHCT